MMLLPNIRRDLTISPLQIMNMLTLLMKEYFFTVPQRVFHWLILLQMFDFHRWFEEYKI